MIDTCTVGYIRFTAVENADVKDQPGMRLVHLSDSDSTHWLGQQEALKSLGLALTTTEIHVVMAELDEDGGGTIDTEFFHRMWAIGRERRRAEKRCKTPTLPDTSSGLSTDWCCCAARRSGPTDWVDVRRCSLRCRSRSTTQPSS